jgi:hypothetical protein
MAHEISTTRLSSHFPYLNCCDRLSVIVWADEDDLAARRWE